MFSQIKEYLVNYWINSPLTFSKKQAVILLLLLGCLGLFYYSRVGQQPAEIKEISSGNYAGRGTIVIDISGEVNRPGVYRVKEGSRLYEAIEKARGLKRTADRNAFNLAQKLQDEQKIVIPGRLNSSSSKSNLINVNQASEKELEELPGIGEAIAARIVAKREADGPFKKVEELNDVEGIGPKKFSQIKDLVTLY